MNVFLIHVGDDDFSRLLPKDLDRSPHDPARVKVMAFPPLGIQTLAPILIRRTKDLDLFVRPADRVELMQRLSEAGFQTEWRFSHWLGKAFKDPLRSLGAISGYMAGRAKRQLTKPEFTKVHPAFRDEAEHAFPRVGVFLELEEGIEGLVHVSELSHEKLATPKGVVNVGDELDAVVLSVDTVERKIALSVKSLQTALEKAELAAYMESQGEATSNLGELLKEGLKKNGDK